MAVPAVLERVSKTDQSVRRRLSPLTWGLVPSWAKDTKIGAKMINARVESVAEKPAFRKAFSARRCLLPADGFYEWYTPEAAGAVARPARPADKTAKKQPFFIHRADGGLLVMAGLYEIWRDPAKDREDDSAWLRTCTVITTEATDAAGHIHDRMPMIIRREAYDAWLDPALTDPEEALAAAGGDRRGGPGGVRRLDRGQQGGQQRSLAVAAAAPRRHRRRARDCSEDRPDHSMRHPDRRRRHAGGPGRGSSSMPRPTRRATLMLGHGAGGGVTAPDLELLARRLPGAGTTVIRFEQPWRTAGRRVAVPPPRLDVGWRAAVGCVAWLPTGARAAAFGGRSAGARVACRTADRVRRRRHRLPGLPAAPAGAAGQVPGVLSC